METNSACKALAICAAAGGAAAESCATFAQSHQHSCLILIRSLSASTMVEVTALVPTLGYHHSSPVRRLPFGPFAPADGAAAAAFAPQYSPAFSLAPPVPAVPAHACARRAQTPTGVAAAMPQAHLLPHPRQLLPLKVLLAGAADLGKCQATPASDGRPTARRGEAQPGGGQTQKPQRRNGV